MTLLLQAEQINGLNVCGTGLFPVGHLSEVGELVAAEYSDAASLRLITLGTRALKRGCIPVPAP